MGKCTNELKPLIEHWLEYFWINKNKQYFHNRVDLNQGRTIAAGTDLVSLGPSSGQYDIFYEKKNIFLVYHNGSSFKNKVKYHMIINAVQHIAELKNSDQTLNSQQTSHIYFTYIP